MKILQEGFATAECSDKTENLPNAALEIFISIKDHSGRMEIIMSHTLKIKKLSPDAVIPKQATRGSAGMDLSACIKEDVVIRPGEIKMIGTGLAVSPDTEECVLLIYARSGLACKNGIAPANCVGVVDSDYRGEIKVALINHGKEDFTVTPGMRIAQLVMTPVILPVIEQVTELDDTERSTGGFGSTGK